MTSQTHCDFGFVLIELGLWCLTPPLSTIVQLYRDGCTNNIETYTVNFKQLF
jgi:hypothetical protein